MESPRRSPQVITQKDDGSSNYYTFDSPVGVVGSDKVRHVFPASVMAKTCAEGFIVDKEGLLTRVPNSYAFLSILCTIWCGGARIRCMHVGAKRVASPYLLFCN